MGNVRFFHAQERLREVESKIQATCVAARPRDLGAASHECVASAG